ncbi:MAG: peptide deformylase, partial [Chloroflexi bacterium]|nr:peptide deformylase [Chloroflexota bacterium]
LDDLAHTMRDAPGVGLAAPQLGEPVQACVIEVENTLHELVNPRIVRSTGDDRDLEGCLSLPGYVAYVTRRERVWVVAQNRLGRKVKLAGAGLLSRALQHELDHLEGKLYIDYLDSMEELIPVAQASGGGDDGGEGEPSESEAAATPLA